MLLDLMGTFAIRRRFAEVAGESKNREVREPDDDDEVIAMVLTQAALFYYWNN